MKVCVSNHKLSTVQMLILGGVHWCVTQRDTKVTQNSTQHKAETMQSESQTKRSVKAEKAMQHQDKETLMMKTDSLEELSASAEFEISGDKTGGAARLLLTDNNHMLPSLIKLILSVHGQDQRNTHTHIRTHR